MKPAYEIVRADELRVGDVVLSSDHTKDVEWSSDAAFYVKAWPQHYQTPKLRRLPPERNPEVLMRALRGAVGFVGFLDQDVDFVCSTWINTAIRELESEAGDGGVS